MKTKSKIKMARLIQGIDSCPRARLFSFPCLSSFVAAHHLHHHI